MKRREFIQFTGIAACGTVVAPTLLGLTPGERDTVKKVHLIFKTHLDVGFTNLAENVIRIYMEEFIPGALTLSENLRKQNDRYVWTTGSWLIYEFLEKASPEMRKRMEKAIECGDITWHGLPFTTHSELADPSLFELGIQLSKRLDKRFGKNTLAAKMTDVPGHTRGIIPVLARNNIKFLHIGVNSASTKPDVPPLFIWQAPDGSEIMVMYAQGYGNQQILPGHQIAVNILFTNDNHGPHKPEQITEIYSELRSQFPNAEVSASTMNDIAADVLRIRNELPVVTQELGDTWIHGVGSDPLKVAKFREISRLRNKWLDEGKLKFGDDADLAFGIPLLMVAEHTWGLDVKKYLKDWNIYLPEDFSAARNKPNFKLMEQSWQEKRVYIDKAISHLPENIASEAKLAIRNLGTEQNDLSDFVPVANFHSDIETEFYTLKIDPKSGSICKLRDKVTGIDWASDQHPLCLFTYQTFSQADYDRFQNQYLIKKIQWAIEDFGKPGLEKIPLKCGIWMPTLNSSYQKINNAGKSILLELTLNDENGISVGGCPEKISVELFFPKEKKEMLVTLKWFNKPAYRLPEASWFSFIPPVTEGIWTLDKMGQEVNFRDVVKNGNRKLHGIINGVQVKSSLGKCSIESNDAALVALGNADFLNFDNVLPEATQGAHFCLHNNTWGTNFAMWFEDNMKYRFVFKS